MKKINWVESLRFYSKLIGDNPNYVQGPGGNTSYKNDKKIWIKASGTRMSKALTEEIFVPLSLDGKVLKKTKLKPSIELDFHLIIPYKFVIHTHSYGSLIYAIGSRGEEKLFKRDDIAFVNYQTPGVNLCKEIISKLDFKKHKSIVLQNHGFISWGNTMEEAYVKLVKFEKFAIESNPHKNIEKVIDHPKALTPDYAVFLSPLTMEEIIKLEGLDSWKKIMCTKMQSIVQHLNLDEEINYLSKSEVEKLQNWSAEKHRVNLNL